MEDLKGSSIAQSENSQSYQSYEEQSEGKVKPVKQPEVITPSALKNKYRFTHELGSGTQGHVYHAVRLSDNMDVAVKELKIGSVNNWKQYELFQREAAVLSSLDIPGVATFYEAIECLEEKQPAAYIFQEFINGKSLAEMMKTGYRFSLQRAYELIVQIIDILEKLHKHDPQVIHRDIKPSNILLKPKGGDDFEVYLIDFGAVANPQVQGGGSTVAGTFGYMPPEQLMGRPVPASDIYALGALAVHLISGVSPADMQNKDFYLVFEPHMQSLPNSLLAVLRAMLAKDIDKRLCDYDKLRQIFTGFMNAKYDMSFTRELGIEAAASEEEVTFREGQYENSLKKVEALGAPGNMDLWIKLPEATPRKCYDYIEKHQLSRQKLSNSSLYSGSQLNQYLGAGSSKGNFIALILLGISLFLMGICLIGSSPLFSVILIGAGLIVLGVAIVKKRGSSNSELRQSELGIRFTDGSGNVQDQAGLNRSFRDLFRNGSKTIATIMDINYVPSSPSQIEVYTGKSDNQMTRIVDHGAPCFTIRYKFNPPDDSNPNDLIHQITVHEDPSDYLEVGDPLPILYAIDRSAGNEFVTSMPFPFPVNDIIKYEDITCRIKQDDRSDEKKTGDEA